MPNPIRFEIMGVMLSCLGHAALLGGLVAVNSNSLDPSKPTPPAQTAMLVNIVQPDGQGASIRSTSRPMSTDTFSPRGEHQREPNDKASLATPLPGSFAKSAPSSSNNAGIATEDGSGVPSAATAAELDEYQRRLYEIVARNSRYPGEARQLRLSGITHLAFRLDRNGNILESWVHHSSGSAMLDNAALSALERSRPLPPIPASLPARMDFVIEIDSSLQQAALRPN